MSVVSTVLSAATLVRFEQGQHSLLPYSGLQSQAFPRYWVGFEPRAKFINLVLVLNSQSNLTRTYMFVMLSLNVSTPDILLNLFIVHPKGKKLYQNINVNMQNLGPLERQIWFQVGEICELCYCSPRFPSLPRLLNPVRQAGARAGAAVHLCNSFIPQNPR